MGVIHIKKFDKEYQTNWVTEQLYLSDCGIRYEFVKNINKIRKAVNSTLDEYLYYEDTLVDAMFFSTSNGYTEDVVSVFGESLPYLKSVESKWDNNSLNNYEVNTQLSKEEFLKKYF